MSTIIGRKIQNRRKQLGLTQEELASKMGYKSKSSINKIELGINDIPQNKIVAFADALLTTPAHLMGWDDGGVYHCPDDENPWILKICELIERENVDMQIAVYEHVESMLRGDKRAQLLTPHETNVMKAYRDQPEMQPAVDRLLGITQDDYVTVYTAANSESNRKHTITRIPQNKWDEIENEPNTDEDLM